MKVRAILTDTGALRKSIGSRTTENSITFFTSLPYAAIHNDGGEIVVTKRMKAFLLAIVIMRTTGASVEEKTANFEKTNEMSGLIQKPIFGCSWL
mgnify:CR=1 FL=1